MRHRRRRARKPWFAAAAFLAALAFVAYALTLSLTGHPDPEQGVMPSTTTPTPSKSSGRPRPQTPVSRPPTTTPTPTPTPTRTTPAPSTPRPSVTRFTSITDKALEQLNAKRSTPVARYTGMDAYAQEWADEMARTDTLVKSPMNPYSAEVIASGVTDATIVIDFWMNTPARLDILNPAYTRVGIGYADGYWVAVFS